MRVLVARAEALSRNPNLPWTEAMIDRFAGRLDWYALARNPALPWSVPFVQKVVASGRITWSDLRWQPAIAREPALCELALRNWLDLPAARWVAGSTKKHGAGPIEPAHWSSWGGPEAAAWAHPLVERMPDALWTYLGAIEGFPWTIEFITKHAERLDWTRLSWNTKLPWNAELVRRFGDRIDWRSATLRVPWTPELARELRDRIDWRLLQDDFPWTPELMEELADRIYWATPDIDFDAWDGSLSGLVQDERLEWTPERFERFRGALEAHFERVFRDHPEIADDGEDAGGEDTDGEGPTSTGPRTATPATGRVRCSSARSSSVASSACRRSTGHRSRGTRGRLGQRSLSRATPMTSSSTNCSATSISRSLVICIASPPA